MSATEQRARPLAGITVAITADRKGSELQSSLQRLGAVVVWGSTMRALPPEVDELLAAETAALLAAKPAWFAVSTGSGLRAWLTASENRGNGDQGHGAAPHCQGGRARRQESRCAARNRCRTRLRVSQRDDG